MLIRITGRVAVLDGDDASVMDEARLRELHGAVSDDVCGNYLTTDLADLGISGGAVKLIYDAAAKQLRVATEYESPDKLGAADLKRLAKETLGQWSDGIGEGCFDDLADRLGVSIDLRPRGQESDLHVEQVEGGGKVRKSSPALHKAAREGDLDKVRSLLEGGANVDSVQQGFPVLHSAISAGKADVALELISRGADLAVRDQLHHDALMCCAFSNRIADEDAARVARVLLERCVDACKLRHKYTPLYMALNRKKDRLAKVLREFGATD